MKAGDRRGEGSGELEKLGVGGTLFLLPAVSGPLTGWLV